MKRRILVTRSQPGAQSTAAALIDRGYEPIVEPLLTIETISATIPAFDALAFTSVNGVRYFSKMHSWRDGPVWCVGARTAAEAKDAGYQDIRSADGDVIALASLIQAEIGADVRLLHPGNEESLGDLAGRLKAHGADATFLPIYRSQPAAAPGPELTRALDGENNIDCILIHSPKAGAILAEFVLSSPAAPRLKVAAISRQSVLKLSGLAIDVAIADNSNETALLEALEGVLGRG